MTEKRKAIELKHGDVMNMMSYLKDLPERGKSPDDPVSFPEIFRTKEYLAEIKNAVERGYTFEDLSKIFSEKCGAEVSVRQIKHHITLNSNKPKKKRVSSPKPPREGNSVSVQAVEKEIINDMGKTPIQDKTMASKVAKSGSFDIDMQQGEI